MPIEVGHDDFQQRVLDASRTRPVLVDFWAPWCGPCLQLAPVLEELEAEWAGRFVLAKVDVQQHPEVGASFGIQAIPALKMFKDGLVESELVGAIDRSQLRAWIAAFVPGEEVEHLAAGRRAEGAGDDDLARTEYERALELRPGHEEASIALAAVLERHGEIERASALVESLSGPVAARIRLERQAAADRDLASLRSAGADAPVEDRFALGIAEALAGDHAAALDALLDVVRRDRSFGDDAGRKAFLDVLELAGHGSELADEYRRKLAMVLY